MSNSSMNEGPELSWAPGFHGDPVSGGKGWTLDDPTAVYGIISGHVDIFAVRVGARDAEGKPVAVGARHFVARLGPDKAFAGGVVHSADSPEGSAGRAGLCLFAVPLGEASVLRMEKTGLWEKLEDPTDRMLYVLAMAEWAEALLATLPDQVAPEPWVPLRPGKGQTASRGSSCIPSGAALCVRLHSGSARLISDTALAVSPKDGFIPLIRETWLLADSDLRYDVVHLVQGIAPDARFAPLETLVRLTLIRIAGRIRDAEIFQAARLSERGRATASIFRQTMESQASILSDPGQQAKDADSTPLFQACRSLGKRQGIDFRLPESAETESGNPVTAIARASGVRCREIKLEGAWWHRDHGPLLGFLDPGGQGDRDEMPAAFLPRMTGGYMVIPGDGSEPFALGASLPLRRGRDAGSLRGSPASRAYMFYRCFPDRVLSAKDILSFSFRDSAADLAGIIFLSLLSSLIALAVPMFTQMVFRDIIPSGDRGSLVGVAAMLGATSLVLSAFAFVQGMFTTRLQGRIDLGLQAAIWDRILRLPAGFFRQFSTGDLAVRILNFSHFTRSVSGNLLPALFGALFSLVNLIFVLAFSPSLAMLALILVLGSTLVSFIVAFLEHGPLHDETEARGRVSGEAFQLLSAIAKLRDSGSEERAFARWGEGFSAMMRHSLKARKISIMGRVFATGFPMLCSALIALAFFRLKPSLFLTGQYMAFNASFGLLLGASTGLTMALAQISGLMPLYRRILPLFRTLPENGVRKSPPGKLRGSVRMTSVSFSYQADGGRTLTDVNLEVRPGEFVGIVGPSGAGKSTLFRLLLGFEQPESGEIHYDGQDLRNLDVAALRRQVSTVLQNGQVFSGSIFDNIAGAAQLTQDEAWAAARFAGIAEDIEAMPMGMFTLVSEGGATLSGGQRQRLLIARALALHPSILLFDETTSALDNRTQATVMHNLEAMRVTRIVIAQRLSTVRGADRIYVLDRGRVVQHGSYDELMSVPGLFRDLVQRQLL